jgi:hypothetical protein
LFVYLDFFFLNLLWLSPYSNNLYTTKREPVFTHFTKVRFFKPVTSYLINLGSTYSIFNIYYKTSLEAFQQINEVAEGVKPMNLSEVRIENKLATTFFKL